MNTCKKVVIALTHICMTRGCVFCITKVIDLLCHIFYISLDTFSYHHLCDVSWANMNMNKWFFNLACHLKVVIWSL